MRKPKLSIEAVREVWANTTPASKLGRWFAENYAEFKTLKRPRWDALAVKFAEEGLIEVPPEFWAEEDTVARQVTRRRAGEAARQTWQREKKKRAIAEKEGQPAARVSRPQSAAPLRRPSPQSTPINPPVIEDTADDEFRTLPRKKP